MSWSWVVGRGRGSCVGRGSSVWVNVVGKKSIEKSDKVKAGPEELGRERGTV